MNKIEKILEDLYNIDASFRTHEAELTKIINKVLLSKPNTSLDQKFVAKLRQELEVKAEELKPYGKKVSIFNFMNFNKFAYASIGAILMLVIIIPIYFLINQSVGLPITKDMNLSEPVKIAKLDKNAFGSLATKQIPAPNQISAGRGEGNDTSMDSIAMSESVESFKAEAKAISTDQMIMPPRDIVNYEYVYEGDEFDMSDSDIAVYQRSKRESLGESYADAAKEINSGLLNLNKFKNTKARSLDIVEDREFGYSVYMNFYDNSLSINTNWEKWPRVGEECQDSLCHDQYRLKEGDVLPDTELVEIANNFLVYYGINTDNYGEPYVNDRWKNNRGRENSVYIPDNISVVYPTKIEDRLTYDDSGNANGMTVNVSIRYKKVASVYGIFKPSYNRSDYKAETNAERIVKFAENGGLWQNYFNENANKTVILKLGTPERHLVRHWHYVPGQEKGSQELFVEALFFPITNLDELDEPFYREYVIVPLAKEILGLQDNDNSVGIPEPMPLLRGGATIEPRLMSDDIKIKAKEIEAKELE